ncbi:TonB-dependent receptor family protein [Xenophilus sp.]|uniref:TonB-dependent receptor family protein n=1 Tax=Xenophilus sp. TaxID=1873499 RepID=UPI0037DD083C
MSSSFRSPSAGWPLFLLPGLVLAQPAPEAPQLPAVTVSTPRGEVVPFDVPGSVERVEGSEIRDGRLQSQLSEGLAGVPGLQLQNRYNYAQDLQLSIRGFGARSTFGVRGVRLYVDGIPATLPDGQGQTSNIDIASLDRIEILRGPFSALYGNSSGGVVQAFTARGEGPPRLAYSAAGGSAGTWRQGVQASGSQGRVDYLLSANRFHTDGWRDHSAATRDLLNGRLGIALDNGDRLTLVFNRVRIDAQDPLGLTAQQFATAPRAAPLATQYDTRKSVLQSQAGLLWEHRLDERQQLRVMLYGGQRDTVQFQSIPPSAQQNPLHAGGVIDLHRNYSGLDLRWLGRFDLAGRPFELVAGLGYDSLSERRSGYENYLGPASAPLLGVRGRLRRLEHNSVASLDPYAQATWRLAEQWTLEAGVRRSRVRFDSRDLYVLGRNGDDSGRARYARTLPVASLRWQPTRDLALYLSAGRGFETPTLNELSYRPDGTGGLNFALRPSVNDSVELGAKARIAGGLLTAALFDTRTRDEIVTATNTGGRSTFQNAGHTRRRGFELGWQHETANHWRTQVALTWLDARYRDAFCSPSPCAGGNLVAAGNRIPGIARQSFYASVGWVPPQGWRAGAELRALGRVQANDRNTASAPGYAVASLYAGYVRQWEKWEFNAFARVDNLAGRRYAGSVFVNEGNARYFEPAPGRTWTVGAGAAYRF